MSDTFDKQSHQDDDKKENPVDYLKRAVAADESGNTLLSMYLYLAAFQQATEANTAPSEEALSGLKQAWALACANKERTMAEYIFELLEPYLSNDEINVCAQELQALALDKLEEFGLSRDELEKMADLVSDELLDGAASIVGIHQYPSPSILSSSLHIDSPKDKESQSSSNQGTPSDDGGSAKIEDSSCGLSMSETEAEYLAAADEEMRSFFSEQEIIKYADLPGYTKVISIMRDLGIGMKDDAEFKDFISMLNSKHGLNQMPALDTILLRSPAREDANRFMLSTLAELSLPTIHMRMEENYQGMPVLCVSAHAVDIPKNNSLKDVFISGGVLVLEDLDLWSSPVADFTDDANAFVMMQLTRGAREAVNLIESAVENPEVFVIVTSSSKGSIDGFFLDLLEPMTLIEIEHPTPEERVEIWMDISSKHPSINGINKADLVRLSANMPRYDIYMAVREAIEDAYKAGLMTRKYVPVSRDNLFDKLAAYQPLDSPEYSELEDAIIKDFQIDLNHLDDLLK